MPDSNTYADLIAAGEAALIAKQAQRAKDILEQARALNPNDFKCLFGLLIANDQLNDVDECLRLGKRCLELAPSHPEIVAKMAAWSHDRAHWKEARGYVDKGILLQPKNIVLRRLRLQILDKFNKSAKVRAVMEQDACDIYQADGNTSRPSHPAILVCALPKSASSSIQKGLELVLKVPGVDDKLCAYADSSGFPRAIPMQLPLGLIAKHGGVLHAHLKPSDETITVLKETGIERIVVTIRDPRQALASWFHHATFGSARDRISLIEPRYSGWQQDDQIAWLIEHYYPQFVDWIDGWHGFHLKDPTIYLVEFASFVEDEVGTVRGIAEHFGLPARDIDAVPRERFRSGRQDEWKSLFNPSQRTQMTAALPAELAEKFGWELGDI